MASKNILHNYPTNYKYNNIDNKLNDYNGIFITFIKKL